MIAAKMHAEGVPGSSSAYPPIITDSSVGTCALGLDVLAAAAAPLDYPEQVNAEMDESDDCADPVAEDEGAGLVVANAVVEALPNAHPTAHEQGAIIARQQKEIAALRELVASQAAAIEQLRRGGCSSGSTQAHGALGTSPPPPYGPASPSSELAHLPSDELEALSPSSTAARPQSGLQHSHSFYHPHLTLVDGGGISGPKPPEVRAPPTPTHHPLGMPRTPPSSHAGEKRLKGADGQVSAAPSPSTLPFTAVTISLPPYRNTVSAKSRPTGRTNTHVLWTAQEDACLRQLVDEHGEQAWALVASRMPHERNNKQCRERWRNHLRPQCNKGPWTEAEDALILERVQQHGTKWARISGQYLPDRPENDIKNRWHILVRMNQHSAPPTGAAPPPPLAGDPMLPALLAPGGSAPVALPHTG